MSSIEDKVCEKIQKRSEVGKSKYGVTMERTDLNTVEWLTHLQEELMDASVYVERLLGDIQLANDAMLNARVLLMKHHEWMSMSDVTSEEDDQEILDVVKALRKASE
ncbi:hypothetical protein CL642_01165 [bacterium]|nr:hypothetical protein [bacterium]|tara:strand:- start:2076 stop:2396 length:321 start_codon:yes stop_codon:yes gene_type:complete